MKQFIHLQSGLVKVCNVKPHSYTAVDEDWNIIKQKYNCILTYSRKPAGKPEWCWHGRSIFTTCRLVRGHIYSLSLTQSMQTHLHWNVFLLIQSHYAACAPVIFSPCHNDMPHELVLLPPGLVSDLLKKLPIKSTITARISSLVLRWGWGICELHPSFGVLYLNGHARCTWKNLN